MNDNKPDPIVEKIELTEEQKQEIRDVMDGKPTKKLVERWDNEGTRSIHERHYRPRSSMERLKKIRNNYFRGGKCAICHNFPSHKVSYKLDYGSVVEYYCQEHFDNSGIKMIKEKHYVNIDDGTEDGLDLEETRYPYYDDNLDLVGYTSELRHTNGKFFAFVDFNNDNEGRIRECPHCLEYEIHNKLGLKIKKKGEHAPDDDQFLSCYECGNTFGIHETHFESKIKDSVQTTDNPFDNESTFLSTDSRKEQRKKGKKSKSRFSYIHEDPEIQREIDRHGSENVRIIQ